MMISFTCCFILHTLYAPIPDLTWGVTHQPLSYVPPNPLVTSPASPGFDPLPAWPRKSDRRTTTTARIYAIVKTDEYASGADGLANIVWLVAAHRNPAISHWQAFMSDIDGADFGLDVYRRCSTEKKASTNRCHVVWIDNKIPGKGNFYVRLFYGSIWTMGRCPRDPYDV